MEREWKGWKLNLKTKPTDGLEETGGKRNKPEQGMEEYSFDLGDTDVNGEIKRKGISWRWSKIEPEKGRCWNSFSVFLKILPFHQREGDTGWSIGFVRKRIANSTRKPFLTEERIKLQLDCLNAVSMQFPWKTQTPVPSWCWYWHMWLHISLLGSWK